MSTLPTINNRKATDARSASAVQLRSAGGGNIEAHQIREGTGTPVVFCHGLVGLNEHWDGVVSRVRGEAECTMLELPLLKLRGPDCSVRGVADLTVDFLDRLTDAAERPVILVGSSFGGHVALWVARLRPDLVRGLVLVGASGVSERHLVKGSPQIRPKRDWLSDRIAELFFDKSKMSESDLDRAHETLSTRGGARAMVKLSRSSRRDTIAQELGHIDRPTLLIWGREDIVTPPSAAERFLELLPRAEIAWIDECGHAPMIEAPEAFSAALLPFVRTLADG